MPSLAEPADTVRRTERILVTGAAGLVGQNLIARLVRPGREIVAVDKHAANLATLRRLQPSVTALEADLAEPGHWEALGGPIDAIVMAHAQIGGLNPDEFRRNNVEATRRVLAFAKRTGVGYLVHISSSVVNSLAHDYYTESKKAQEALVTAGDIPCAILRPTLMFGWFDRKHLGWLRRFMAASPVFPIPGDGRFTRQPLFAGDFCAVVDACLADRVEGVHDISGLEQIAYIDLIRAVRAASGSRTPIVKLPLPLFRTLLRAYALVDRDPPFTTAQLDALIKPELFVVTDWPERFGVAPTPLSRALETTFGDETYASVVLDF